MRYEDAVMLILDDHHTIIRPQRVVTNGVSLLQTKLSDREGYEARRIGLEAMPLDQHIEGRHGEREPGLKIGPAPMHHLFEMADKRQHGEHGLHQHAVLPRAALT